MARVKGPFFSTFARGTISKCLTCNPRYAHNTFHMSIAKRSAGPRYQIQIDNANIFRMRKHIGYLQDHGER